MKTLKILSVLFFGTFLLSSCTADIIIEEDVYIEEPSISLNEVLNSYEIWYIDIERTQGSGEIPFLQKAFTVSFEDGTFYANNNLVGIGANGNGFGLAVGYYNTIGMDVDISHDIDGFYSIQVTQLGANEIRLYDAVSNTSYYLEGYQRNTFDYDKVFYDNIHYFLHEYTTWEKVYTSEFGALNEFDDENYLSFLYNGSADNFRSSQDVNGTNINSLYFDYTGYYTVDDIDNDFYKKILTLDYDYLGNDYFELTVINDRTIELFHPTSGTVYQFVGRAYLQFKSTENGKKTQNDKKRMKKSDFIKITT